MQTAAIIGILAACALISYLFGSISFAVIFSRAFVKKDVRSMGSGNAGMTNVMRTAGKVPGALTFVMDLLKGVAPCLIGRFAVFPLLLGQAGTSALFVPQVGALLCGLFCILGHVFPVFFGFRGGKGVATTLGVMLVADWRVALLALGLFLLLVILTRVVSIGSVCAAASIVPLSAVFAQNAVAHARLLQVLLTAIIGLIVILKHKDNIVRLFHGQEKPLWGKKEG